MLKRLLAKPIIVENSRIPRWLSWFIEIKAITLWPFVFVRGELGPRTRSHETIHFHQYKELWVLGFYAVYLFDFLLGTIKYKKDKKKAYRQIRFEQEAYACQDKEDYLETRVKFAWKEYKI